MIRRHDARLMGDDMKAWQFLGPGQPLMLTDLPDPSPAQGEVVIDVKAAGLCHTDIGILEGWSAGMLDHLPLVLGHEVAGVVVEVGEGVGDYQVGDEVGIVGEGLGGPGVGRDGGFAERTIGRVSELVRIPDGVGFGQAAAGTDAGMTSYHAVRVVAAVASGMRVGIIGLGGLGLVGARLAVLAGAEVYAAEVNTDVHDFGRELGITNIVSDSDQLAGLDLDVVVDFAGMETAAAAVAAVRPFGQVVLVGCGNPTATLDLMTTVMKQVQLVGSLGGTRDDVVEVYGLLGSGDLKMMISAIGFDQIADGLDRLQNGQVRGRLVAVSA
jgi:alcohol dehydrogenase, propanol-preferring